MMEDIDIQIGWLYHIVSLTISIWKRLETEYNRDLENLNFLKIYQGLIWNS